MSAPTQPEDGHLDSAYEDRNGGETFLQIPGAVDDFDVYDDEDLLWEDFDDEIED